MTSFPIRLPQCYTKQCIRSSRDQVYTDVNVFLREVVISFKTKVQTCSNGHDVQKN